jgi:hypothetical protein
VIEYESQANRLVLPSPRLTALPVEAPQSGPLLWLLAHPIADRLADPGDAARYRYLDSTQLLRDHLRYWSIRWLAPFPQRWQTHMKETLRAAEQDGSLVSPRAVNLFSASRTQAHLAYYAAMTMADYIAETYGPEGLLRLERVLTQTPSWERAFPVALGVNVDDFEREWRAYLGDQ